MGISAALTADLLDLCGSVDVDPGEIGLSVSSLSGSVSLVTPSYLGLQLDLASHGRTASLTSFEPAVLVDDIATSLRIPLNVLSRATRDPTPTGEDPFHDPDSAITLFAATPGAFVDLAADLTYAVRSSYGRTPTGSPGHRAPDEIQLDLHLTPVSVTSGLAGAADVSTVDRAVGILIGRGLEPEAAHRELVRRSASTGHTVLVCAVQLLRGPADSPTVLAVSLRSRSRG